MDNEAARVVIVVGQPQYGKTTLAFNTMRTLSPRVLVLDPRRARCLSDQVRRGAARSCSSWATLAAFLADDSVSGGGWCVILRSERDADYRAALEHGRYYRHVAVLADEALYYTSDPALLQALTDFSRANAHYGDGLGVPLWITAQRPLDVPRDIRAPASGFIAFRQEEPGDLEFLAKRCSPSFAEDVAGLDKYRWIASPPALKDLITHEPARKVRGAGAGDVRRAGAHQGVSGDQPGALRPANLAAGVNPAHQETTT